MKTKLVDNAKLGFFIMAGLLFLVLTLYMIGKNKNLFGSTFTIQASVSNVNGLMRGNNVRFKGIDVGTVKNIKIENDSTILVVLIIDSKMKPYIKQNAIASIGTDGLMGNKLININPGPGVAKPIEEGSTIRSLEPIEIDAILRTLGTTNNTIAVVSKNLQEITGKLNNSNSLWNLLADTSVSSDFKDAIRDIRKAGKNTARFTAQADELIYELQNGEGLAAALLTDTIVFKTLNASVNQIKKGSDDLNTFINHLNEVVSKIEKGEGTTGLLISDSTVRSTLQQSLLNIEQGTSKFNENMEALKHNFLFRGYFRRQSRGNNDK